MEVQAYLSVIVFAAAIIFSIVMAAISPAFREQWHLTNVWNFTLFFTIILTAAILLTMSVQCSAYFPKDIQFNTGKSGSKNNCKNYAWMLVVLVLGLLALYMTQAIVKHVEEKKEKSSAVVKSNISVVSSEA